MKAIKLQLYIKQRKGLANKYKKTHFSALAFSGECKPVFHGHDRLARV